MTNYNIKSLGGTLTLASPLNGGVADFGYGNTAKETLVIDPTAIATLSSTVNSGGTTVVTPLDNVQGTFIVPTSGTVFQTIVTAATGLIAGTVRNFDVSDEVILHDLNAQETAAGYGNLAIVTGVAAGNALTISAVNGGASKAGGGYTLTGDSTVELGLNILGGAGGSGYNSLLSLLELIEEDTIGSLSTTGSFVLTIGKENSDGDYDGTLTTSQNVGVNPCFAEGTRILTEAGEVEVENLKAGDMIVTMDGGLAPVVWLGTRKLSNLAAHPRPETVRPVVIRAGAFADGVPARDLTVSPDHAFYFDGVLVMARDLIDGVTITQDKKRASVTYYHVQLPQHGVLLAEGAAAESFLDTGHRGVFDNAGEAVELHPDLMAIRRKAEGCAPLCDGGEALAEVRTRLHARKMILGYGVANWTAPRLLVGDKFILPAIESDTVFTFALPEGTSEALLLNPEFVPAEVDPSSNDRRRLGMGVRAVTVDGRQVALADIANAADLRSMGSDDLATWTAGTVRLAFGRVATTLSISAAAMPRLWGKRVAA